MDESNMTDRLNSLLQQGIVDEQFLQLQQLEDESNPDFLAEVIGLYFEDSERLIDELTKALSQNPVDFKIVDAHVHQFKGSSSSIGVLRMKNACISFRSLCEACDLEGCWQALQQLKQEYILLKGKLEELFEGNPSLCQMESPWPQQNKQIEHPFDVHSGEAMSA